MVPERFDRERGQILVQVAIMAGVLFAFVALAVDAGQVYGGRRRMQNAADAGALAGAREICEGGHGSISAAHTEAEATAMQYAIGRNGAQTATVDFPDDHTVAVTAAQTLDTFFAGVIGISTANVRAEAAARCSGAAGAGGLWPLAFNFDRYTNDDIIPCNEEFLVFSALDESDCADECCDCENEAVFDREGCESISWNQDCKGLLDCPAIGAHFATSSRGWLLFKRPEDPYPVPEACRSVTQTDPCGRPTVACWLGEDYPEEIREGFCLPGDEGMGWDSNVRQAVQSRIDNEDVVRVVLWDRACYDGSEGSEEDRDPFGDCPGTPDWYHVAGFGCILPTQITYQPNEVEFDTCDGKTQGMHVIKAIKICEGDPRYEQFCSATPGTGSGQLPREWESRVVALIE